MFAKAQVNGHDVGRFVIDTGCASICVDRGIVEKLALSKMEHHVVELRGHVGKTTTDLVRTKTVAIGGVPFINDDATVMDTEWATALLGVEMNGVVGTPILGTMPFTIDPQALTLTFYLRESFRPPAGSQVVDLTFSKDNRPYIPIIVNGQPIVIALDTGDDGALELSGSFVRQNPGIGVMKPDAQWEYQTSIEKFERIRTRYDSIEVFGHVFRDVRGAVIQQMAGVDEEPGKKPGYAGVIGNVLLRNFRLTFDYENSKLYVEWRPWPTMKERLGRGLHPNQCDAGGTSVLCQTIADGDLDGVGALIAAGANPNARSRLGANPLGTAVMYGNAAIAEQLLDVGAETKDATWGDYLVEAAYTGNAGMCQLLMKHGSNVQTLSPQGRTALSWAAQYGRLEVVKMLLDHGADYGIKDSNGKTALHYAEGSGQKEIVDLLRACGARE